MHMQNASHEAVYSLPKPPGSSGLAARLQYRLQATALPQDSGLQCVISASRIGPYMILAARLLSSPEAAIQLRLSMADDVPQDFHQSARQSGAATSPELAISQQGLAGLQEKLEAELVLLLMKRCFAAAGQQLPPGLLGLQGALATQPAELLSQILSHLDVCPLNKCMLSHCRGENPHQLLPGQSCLLL